MLAREIAIGFGVAIVFPLLLYYGVSTFNHAPKWRNLQPELQLSPHPTAAEIAARAEKQKAQTAAYTEAERAFSLRLFCVSAPPGYIAIIFGSLGRASGLQIGLMFGGIFAVANGYAWHWS